jgi:hypothetical protein
MIFRISKTQSLIKTVFLILIVIVSINYSKNLKPISIHTNWRYKVHFSDVGYSGKFLEKIVVHDTDCFKVDIYNLGIDQKSLSSLRLSGIRFDNTQPAKIFIIKDSIFMQSLVSKTPCAGLPPPPPPSYPNINVLDGYIIQTDSLRIQVINNYVTHVIPVTYDSAQHLFFAYRNYFSKDCETLQLFEYRREKDRDPNIIEFTGRITTSGSEPAAIDSNGVRYVSVSDYSDVMPCNSSGMIINLDTTKLQVKYVHTNYVTPLFTSNSKFTNFLLNGRVFSTTDINSPRIEITKSGIRTVKLP